METEKYIQAGFFIRDLNPDLRSPLMGFEDGKDGSKRGFKASWVVIKKPQLLVEDNHKHDFDQLLCFIGGDPNNSTELNGEVEFTLSEDGINMEKHIFKSATSVFIPAGLFHGPLNITRVNTSILHVNIFFADNYIRI